MVIPSSLAFKDEFAAVFSEIQKFFHDLRFQKRRLRDDQGFKMGDLIVFDFAACYGFIGDLFFVKQPIPCVKQPEITTEERLVDLGFKDAAASV